MSTLDAFYHGGLDYVQVEFSEMFNMLDVFVTTLHQYLNNFARDGVLQFPGKNVGLLVQKFRAVCVLLQENNALPCDAVVFGT